MVNLHAQSFTLHSQDPRHKTMRKILPTLLAQHLTFMMMKRHNFEIKLKRSTEYSNQGNNQRADFMPYLFHQDGAFGAVIH